MRTREQILKRIEAFLARTGVTERAFGFAVAGDHKFVRRLRDTGVTLTLIERAEQIMSAPTPWRLDVDDDGQSGSIIDRDGTRISLLKEGRGLEGADVMVLRVNAAGVEAQQRDAA